MLPINWTRVILGGLVAGVVINLIEFLVNGVALTQAWSDAMRGLNRTSSFGAMEVASFNVWGFLMGIAAVALYAAIRDRSGPGVRTAICAGLALWAVGYLFSTIPAMAMHLFPRTLLLYGVIAGLFESVLGTIAGAWVYRPSEMTTRSAGA